MEKSRFIKPVVALFSFLLIFLASLYFLRPVYREIDSRMRQAQARFLSEFLEATGVGLSYGSISPSILTGITINNIRIYDFQTGEDILTARKAVFRYRLWSLLTRNLDNAFSILSISDVKGDFSSEKIAAIRKSLAENRERKRKAAVRVQGESGGAAGGGSVEDPVAQAPGPVAVQVDGLADGEFLSEDQKAFINKVFSSLPAKLLLKNVDVHYSTKGKRLDFKLGKLAFAKKGSRNVSATADSGLVMLHFPSGKSAAARFNLNGNIVPGFSGSSSILTISPYLAAD
ncbi:MAG: hypothetical protein ILP18_02250 [Treponema sp.]|nr:hypothetical protein [Treponema sp.]